MTINPLLVQALAGLNCAYEPQPYQRHRFGHDRGRKHQWNKAVQRRRKHRAMTKAMRQNLRRR